jgi:hypothetical protein
MKAKAQATTKKPYKKPTLKVYGNIGALTKTTPSASTNSDGVAANKTH